MALLVAYGWPRLWYHHLDGVPRWFAEVKALPNWTAHPLALSEAAEAQLGADTFLNEEFVRADGARVRAFTAKRFTGSGSDAGLFSHTPDRCWVTAGWTLQDTQPETAGASIGGLEMAFERRCFRVGNATELVYFGALVGGEPLPFRLNQYLRLAKESRKGRFNANTEALTRAKDPQFWAWMWNCFRTRRSFSGPTHFIRVSTPVDAAGLAAGDQLLQEFLRAFFIPADFQTERAKWLDKQKSIR